MLVVVIPQAYKIRNITYASRVPHLLCGEIPYANQWVRGTSHQIRNDDAM
jgi:hypothetical protein